MTAGARPDARWAGRVMRVLGALVLLAFFVTAFTPAVNHLEPRLAASPELRPADAIVVLGQAVLADGTLPPVSLQRTVYGIRLFKRGLAPLILFSGGRLPDGVSEATVRAKLAEELGVPSTAILTETDVQTTRDEARRIAGQLGPRGARRILLVSEGAHLQRARGLFARVGFDVLTAPSDGRLGDADDPEARIFTLRGIVSEVAARLYAAPL